MAAPRVSDNPEVQQHYVTQMALTAALVQALRRLWPMLKPSTVITTADHYKAGVAALVDQYSLAAASLSADYYDALRSQAGVAAPFHMPMVDPPPDGQVAHYVDWATTGLDRATTAKTFDELAGMVQSKVEAVSQKFVADTGRNEIIAAIEADTQARRWARVTRPNACYFCRMLATRGAVYRSEATAEFKAHTNCHCVVEPVFSMHYEPPAHTRADQSLWYEVTSGIHGSKAKMLAWRHALEAQN